MADKDPIDHLRREAFPSYEEACRAFCALSQKERDALFIHKTRPVFEVFNRTHVNALAAYIVDAGWSRVLEVGAGDGRLSKHLNEAIHRVFRRRREKGEHPRQIRIVATDNGSWNIETVFPVERLDLAAALKAYDPELVIWSWMPIGDWTYLIRRHASVQEYILIGETEDGECGNADAWNPALYEADGFTRHDLNDISRYQLARNDTDPAHSRSKTVSFRRNRP
ncbi:MAG TPA: hypothetical protein PLP29_12230 [Candidatus Ozemobacteraceae bacterium]|nr:hypothetical protein [Candidatus Ozemobacteraceae bacterium]